MVVLPMERVDLSCAPTWHFHGCPHLTPGVGVQPNAVSYE